MSTKKNKLFPFFALLLVVFAFVVPVSADVTLYFTDRAYFGDNPIVISQMNGTEVFNGTTQSGGIVLPDIPGQSSAYWITFQPGGLSDYASNPDYFASTTFGTAQKFGIGILLICFVGIVIWWRNR